MPVNQVFQVFQELRLEDHQPPAARVQGRVAQPSPRDSGGSSSERALAKAASRRSAFRGEISRWAVSIRLCDPSAAIMVVHFMG